MKPADLTPAVTRQRGTATVVHSGTAGSSVTVTFPKAFPTTPKVIVSVNRAPADFLVAVSSVSTTGCVIVTNYLLNTGVSASVPVVWDAAI